MSVGIEAIEYYLPERFMTSGDLASNFGFDLQFVEEKIGVKRIYIAGENEKTSDMAVAAIKKLFEKRPDIKEKIEVIAVCTQTPDYQLPHTSALVQKKLGLGMDIACFDIGLGCSGFVYGLSVVKAFMEENEMEYGILVTAETYSKIINERDKNTKPLFSDAAAATLIGREPYLTPLKFTFGTNGNGYDSLILRNQDYLFMDGRGIFEFVATIVPEDLRRCFEINHLGINEIDYFVFHQASNFMVDTISKKLGLSNDKRIIKCIDRFGNTVSSSIPIAITTMLDNSNHKNQKILISGFGVGLSWASTILST